MPQEARRRDLLVGLFALGLILFNPPTLRIFASSTMFGWRFLFQYLFWAWAALTAMIANRRVAKIGLQNLAYNVRRRVTLERIAAA